MTGSILINKLIGDTHEILFCECKWQKRKSDAVDIKHLLDKAPQVNRFNRDRKDHFAFISKAGFTGKAVEFAHDNGVLLFEMKDMGDHFR